MSKIVGSLIVGAVALGGFLTFKRYSKMIRDLDASIDDFIIEAFPPKPQPSKADTEAAELEKYKLYAAGKTAEAIKAAHEEAKKSVEEPERPVKTHFELDKLQKPRKPRSRKPKTDNVVPLTKPRTKPTPSKE